MWQVKVTHTKMKHTGLNMKIKLAKDGKRLTSYVGKKCRAFVQHVAAVGTHVPAIDVVHRLVHKK